VRCADGSDTGSFGSRTLCVSLSLAPSRAPISQLSKLETSSDNKKRKSSSSATPASSSAKSYILRTPNFPSVGLRGAFHPALNQFSEGNNGGEDPTKGADTLARKGLLFWIYALIHAEESAQSGEAAGGEQVKGCAEIKLWKMLQTLGIERDMVRSSTIAHSRGA
jgi:hypothetical protein